MLLCCCTQRSHSVFHLNSSALDSLSAVGALLHGHCIAFKWYNVWPSELTDLCVQGEGNGAFVERVQQAIATELGTPISNLTLQGKRKLMQAAQKRLDLLLRCLTCQT